MRMAACSSASTCASLMPATIVCQSPRSAIRSSLLLDDEHLVDVELVRDPLGAVRAHYHHVLDVVALLGRLERQHHSFLQHELVTARDHQLLLMPPAADPLVAPGAAASTKATL